MDWLKTLFFPLLFLLSILSQAIATTCELLPAHQNLTCQGTFVAKTPQALANYAATLKVKDGFAKHLAIDFDVNQESLTIATPCRIRLRENRKIELTGNLCLRGNEEVTILPSSTIEVQDLSLYSKNKIVIRENADVEARDILLHSEGANLNSNVHLRHTSSYKAQNLQLIAHAKATLGHTSTYQIASNLKIKSNDYELASVWKNTKVEANYFELLANTRALIAQGVEIDAPTIKLEAKECGISKKAIITATEKLGSCFLGTHPIARLKASVLTGIAPLTVNFDASKSSDDQGIVEYSFQFTNTDFLAQPTPTASFTFDTPGTYLVRVIVKDADGLQARTTRKIVVEKPFENIPPVPNFECWYDSASRNYGCWSQATDSDGYPAFSKFEVSNGKTYDAWSFEDNFAEAGVYTVTFTVTDNLGAEATSSKTLYIDANQPPVAQFSCSTNLLNLSCYSQAEDPDGYVTNPVWMINGEVVSNDWNFNFVAPQEGSYTVTFKISDGVGAEDTKTQDFVLTQNIAPVASFNCWQGPDNNAFGCSNDSTDSDGFIAQGFFRVNGVPVNELGGNIEFDATSEYQWWFNYYDLMPGSYHVSLAVIDNHGAVSTLERVITLTEVNIGEVNAVINCQLNSDQTVSCSAAGSSSTVGSIVDYQWEFSDGGSASGLETTHYFANGGAGYVRLTVYNEFNQSVSKEFYFDFSTLIYPVISCQVTDNRNVQCSSRGSSTVQGIIENTTWVFGDGTILSGLDINHRYTTGGTYTIQATVYNSYGHGAMASTVIEVSEPNAPTVNFDCSVNHSTKMLDCFDESTDSSAITSRLWQVNDGNPTSGNSQSFTYTLGDVGFYTVSLTVMNEFGKDAKLVRQFELLTPITARIELSENQVLIGSTIVANALVDESTNENLSYSWTLDNGMSFSGEQIEINLSERYVGNLTLTVLNDHGVSKSVSVFVGIYSIDEQVQSHSQINEVNFNRNTFSAIPQYIDFEISSGAFASDNFDDSGNVDHGIEVKVNDSLVDWDVHIERLSDKRFRVKDIWLKGHNKIEINAFNQYGFSVSHIADYLLGDYQWDLVPLLNNESVSGFLGKVCDIEFSQICYEFDSLQRNVIIENLDESRKVKVFVLSENASFADYVNVDSTPDIKLTELPARNGIQNLDFKHGLIGWETNDESKISLVPDYDPDLGPIVSYYNQKIPLKTLEMFYRTTFQSAFAEDYDPRNLRVEGSPAGTEVRKQADIPPGAKHAFIAISSTTKSNHDLLASDLGASFEIMASMEDGPSKNKFQAELNRISIYPSGFGGDSSTERHTHVAYYSIAIPVTGNVGNLFITTRVIDKHPELGAFAANIKSIYFSDLEIDVELTGVTEYSKTGHPSRVDLMKHISVGNRDVGGSSLFAYVKNKHGHYPVVLPSNTYATIQFLQNGFPLNIKEYPDSQVRKEVPALMGNGVLTEDTGSFIWKLYEVQSIETYDYSTDIRVNLLIKRNGQTILASTLNSGGVELFSPLRTISNLPGIDRYKSSDYFHGGDGWANNSTYNLMDAIKDDVNFGISFGDFSKINGGRWYPHDTHQSGSDIDFVTSGYMSTSCNGATPSVANGVTEFICNHPESNTADVNAASGVVRALNIFDKKYSKDFNVIVQGYFAGKDNTMFIPKGLSTWRFRSPKKSFVDELNNTCLDSGIMANQYIRTDDTGTHSGHMHLSLLTKPKISRVSVPAPEISFEGDERWTGGGLASEIELPYDQNFMRTIINATHPVGGKTIWFFKSGEYSRSFETNEGKVKIYFDSIPEGAHQDINTIVLPGQDYTLRVINLESDGYSCARGETRISWDHYYMLKRFSVFVRDLSDAGGSVEICRKSYFADSYYVAFESYLKDISVITKYGVYDFPRISLNPICHSFYVPHSDYVLKKVDGVCYHSIGVNLDYTLEEGIIKDHHQEFFGYDKRIECP